MQIGNQEAERLTREGIQALQQGRVAEARSRFEAVVAGGEGGAQTWLLLAIACRAQQDDGPRKRRWTDCSRSRRRRCAAW